MSKYHENELFRIVPIPPEKLEYPIKIKLHSEHGETKWMNISAKQFRKIETLLCDGE